MSQPLRDPERLRERARALTTRAEVDARDVASRRAAAEAYVRLAILDAGGDSPGLLRRATDLDPYRPEAWMLLGRAEHDAGAFVAALEHYDMAAMLAPSDPRIALYRARTQIRLAAAAGSAKHADAAVEALARANAGSAASPDHLLATIEATIHASAKRLREDLPKLLARLPATDALRSRITRALYLAVCSLGVGAKHDDRNGEVLDSVIAVADRFAKASLTDPSMAGTAAAAAAKRCSAEQICDRIDEFARDIPDVRLVRLLLRERLATVTDPSQRLAWFERAMAKIPSLDGIAHDYLQLLHLVAKRAVATGDVEAARASWSACLTRDADNLAVLENLLRLATTVGDQKSRAALTLRVGELRHVYVAHSPRADLVVARASAALFADAEHALESATSAGRKLELSEAPAILHAIARSGALGRLAHDPSARAATPREAAAKLLDQDVRDASVFDAAVATLGQPLFDEVPAAYALIDVTKDAPPALIDEARTKRLEALDLQLAREPDPYVAAMRARVERETAVLLDSGSRATYDALTAPIELAEMLRHHARAVSMVMAQLQDATSIDVPMRIHVVDLVRRLVPECVRPYAALHSSSERAFDEKVGLALCGAALLAARAKQDDGEVEAAVDTLAPFGDAASGVRAYQAVMAQLITDDPRLSLDEAIAAGRNHARLAHALAEGNEPSGLIAAMATEPDAAFRQRVGHDRAALMLRRERFRSALDALRSAYPGDAVDNPQPIRPAGREREPPALVWAELVPCGRLRYAVIVGRALRASTIRWYNDASAWSRYEFLDHRHSVLIALRAAYHWAHYVIAAAPSAVDTSDDGDSRDEWAGRAADLLTQLEDDRVQMMEINR